MYFTQLTFAMSWSTVYWAFLAFPAPFSEFSPSPSTSVERNDERHAKHGSQGQGRQCQTSVMRKLASL